MSASVPKSNEDFYAEQPAIEWLEQLGWDHEHGGDLAPNGPGLRMSGSSWNLVDGPGGLMVRR